MSNNRYHRIGDDDVPQTMDTEMTDIAQTETIVVSPLAQQEGQFSVKILHKEKAFEISGMRDSSTIAELKEAAHLATTVPSNLQRLIFAGKQLKPDNKTLADFKIYSGASIHLFPLPTVQQPLPPVATAVASGGTYNPLSVTAVPAASAPEISHRPIHFDADVNQASREVKLWCLILMFLSGMTLFNNLSFMTSTGKLGVGPLDTVVTVIDTVASACGLIVGNMGMRSLRTMELADVNKYVQALMSLALLCIMLRVLWVADVIFQAQKLVRDSKDSDSGNTDNDNGKDHGSTTDPTDDGGEQPDLDGKTVVTFGIQASIIALICIFAWGSCVMRARRLQSVVQEYSRERTPATTATQV